jgi:uncharacterized protein
MASLASFLFTPKQQRLLAAVLLNPERGFTFTELHEQAQGGNSSLQGYLRTLVEAGLLQVQKHRSSKLYRFNSDHPLAPELRAIAIKSFALTEPLVQALNPLASHIDEAFIFGSIAKGTARHDSDIDLMLIGDVSVGRASLAVKEVEEVLGRSIHLNVYSFAEWQQMSVSDPVVAAIAKGPRIELELSTATAGGIVKPRKDRGTKTDAV